MDVKFIPLVILIVFILLCLWIVKNRSSNGQFSGLSLSQFILLQYSFFGIAIIISMILLQDFIHIPITLSNAFKITTAFYLPYFVLSIKVQR